MPRPKTSKLVAVEPVVEAKPPEPEHPAQPTISKAEMVTQALAEGVETPRWPAT